MRSGPPRKQMSDSLWRLITSSGGIGSQPVMQILPGIFKSRAAIRILVGFQLITSARVYTVGVVVDDPFVMFRVEHITRGLGLVIALEEWTGDSVLYHVEFDSGESALVFSHACKLETDSEDVK